MQDRAPSPWVVRFASSLPVGASVVDVAAGRGRHARLLAELGHDVTALDRDTSGLVDLATHPRVEVVAADLEAGPWPWPGRRFGGVVVTDYLHRPLLGQLVAAVAPGGLLIYETFARGQERHGRPSNPDWLLRPGELLEAVRGELRVMAYEDLRTPRPACVQRVAATRP